MDAVPDFVVGLGYLDDIALLSWLFQNVATELKRFSQWEKIQADRAQGITA